MMATSITLMSLPSFFLSGAVELRFLPVALIQTPLHLAVYLNQVSVVKALLANGACLELQDQDGNTPLHVACEHGRLDCANEMFRQPSLSKITPVFEAQNWRGNTAVCIL